MFDPVAFIIYLTVVGSAALVVAVVGWALLVKWISNA